MSLSVHILERGVEFPPAPREICKWNQKIPFFHDEGAGMTSRTDLSGGHLGSAAHSGT